MTKLEGTISRIEREGLQYRRGDLSVNIGTYGRWDRGATVEFIVNGRWNPPRSGPVLLDSDIVDIELKLRAYASKCGVLPSISVDWS